jgi:hypothetical protein
VCIAQILLRDPVLIQESDSKDKLTKVLEVYFRENAVENPGAQPIEIEKKLPSFVAASKLLCDVAWRTIKRARKIM